MWIRSILSVFVVFAFGCKPREDSSLKHQRHAYFAENLPGLWEGVSFDEFGRVIKNFRSMGNSNFRSKALPESHVLSKRLQSWVDLIDRAARAKHPNKNWSMIPAPKVAVLFNHASADNAWFGNIPVASPVSVLINNQSYKRGKYKAYVSLPDEEGGLWVNPFSGGLLGREAIKRDFAAEKFLSNLEKQSPCKVSVQRNTLLFNGQCDAGDLKDTAIVGAVRMALPNWVVLGVEFLKRGFTEADIVAILAHELAHYYRAHIFFRDTHYGYFYKGSERDDQGVPIKSAAMQAMSEKIKAASKKIRKVELFQGHSYPSIFYETWAELVPAITSRTPACNKLKKAFADTYSHSKYDLQYDVPSRSDAEYARTRRAREDFTRDVEGCFATVVGPEMKKVHEHESFTYFNSSFLDEPKAGDKNLLATFTRIREQLITTMDQLVVLWQKAADADFGYYTYEQEADEIGADLLSEIGLEARFAVDALMKLIPEESDGSAHLQDTRLGRSFQKVLRAAAGFSRQQCEEVRARDWKSDGGWEAVLLGSLEDPHHSACYRALNLAREIASHRYTPRGEAPAFLDNWTDLIDAL